MYANSPFQVPMAISITKNINVPKQAPLLTSFPKFVVRSACNLPHSIHGSSQGYYGSKQIYQSKQTNFDRRVRQIPLALAPSSTHIPVRATTTIYLPKQCCQHCPYRSCHSIKHVDHNLQIQGQKIDNFTNNVIPMSYNHLNQYQQQKFNYQSTHFPYEPINSFSELQTNHLHTGKSNLAERNHQFQFGHFTFQKNKKYRRQNNFKKLNRIRSQPRLQNHKDYVRQENKRSFQGRIPQQAGNSHLEFRKARNENVQSKQLYKFYNQLLKQQSLNKSLGKSHSCLVSRHQEKYLNKNMKTQACQLCDQKLIKKQAQEIFEQPTEETHTKDYWVQQRQLLRLRIKQQQNIRIQKSLQLEKLKQTNLRRKTEHSKLKQSNNRVKDYLVQSQFHQQFTPVQIIQQSKAHSRKNKRCNQVKFTLPQQQYNLFEVFDIQKKKQMLKVLKQANSQPIFQTIDNFQHQKQFKVLNMAHRDTKPLKKSKIDDRINDLKSQNQRLWDLIRQ